MKHFIVTIFSFVVSIMLFPYLFVLFTTDTDMGIKEKKLEIVDSLLLWKCALILEEGEEEAEKAQIVIARTNLYRELVSKQGMYKKILEIQEEIQKAGITSLKDREKKIEKWKTWIEDTKGEILNWNGSIKELPVHNCSAGKTRSGEEILGKEYAYLSSVDSEIDKNWEKYMEERVYDIEDFPEDLKIIDRDCAGYVRTLLADGRLIAGEVFCQKYYLPSSDFIIYRTKKHLIIVCRGRGHGFGYSIYGGDYLARKGKDYKQILKIYFPQMKMIKL